MMPNIYILSGPVQTGKTTRLKRWLETIDRPAGIMAPVIDGQRHLKNIRSGELRQLQAENGQDIDNAVTIGRFIFREDVFRWARRVLQTAAEQKPQWIVIDEIGPLELSGRGLEPAVSELLKNSGQLNGINLLLVIRDKTMEKTLEHYQLDLKKIHIIKHTLADRDKALL